MLTVAVLLVGCGGGSDGTARQDSPNRSPDGTLDARVDRLARTQFEGVTSILVARAGHLILERYYEGLRASDRVPAFSITKTFVSCLIGIALADKSLESVDQRLGQILPETHSEITLRQLLTMTAGFGRGLNFQARDPADLANRPLVNTPGAVFTYDSGSSDLLAAVVERAAGISIGTYAHRRLFRPLGIRGTRWPEGHGGSGLVLRPRDLLAFGQLYLDGGRRIVPATWVAASTRGQVAVEPGQGLTEAYGYNWWIDDRKPRSYTAHGYLGQALTIFPTLDLVVVVTSSNEKRESGFTLARLIARAQS